MLISFVYFFFLMASYFILRPLRDTMGTVYGVAHLQELFTGTFVLSFIVAPIFAGLASRIRLATFLPWVYGFIAITMVVFYVLFQSVPNDRWVAAAFYVWLSTFNLLTISVFWSLMADIFSSAQAKRLFGFIAAGGTVGTISAPAFVTLFVNSGRHQQPAADFGGGLRHHRLSGAPAGSGKAQACRQRRGGAEDHAWTTGWAAIRSTASRCCSGRAIC